MRALPLQERAGSVSAPREERALDPRRSGRSEQWSAWSLRPLVITCSYHVCHLNCAHFAATLAFLLSSRSATRNIASPAFTSSLHLTSIQSIKPVIPNMSIISSSTGSPWFETPLAVSGWSSDSSCSDCSSGSSGYQVLLSRLINESYLSNTWQYSQLDDTEEQSCSGSATRSSRSNSPSQSLIKVRGLSFPFVREIWN